MIEKIKKTLNLLADKEKLFFTSLTPSELEVWAANFKFKQSLSFVNLNPVERFPSAINRQGMVVYRFTVDIQFLTNFDKDDTSTGVKDTRIDSMIKISDRFFMNMQANKWGVFLNSSWVFQHTVLRQYLSELILGVEVRTTLETACNRPFIEAENNDIEAENNDIEAENNDDIEAENNDIVPVP